MADQAKNPANTEPSTDVVASLTPPRPQSEPPRGRFVNAQVRRSPRYSRFLLVGAMLGVIVAAILAFGVQRVDVPQIGEAVFSDGQVFGFLALIGIATGVLLGGVVALILERVVGRNVRTVHADYETTATPPR